MLSFIGASLFGAIAGYLLFYGLQGNSGQFPAPLRAIYQAIKDLQEIFSAFGPVLLIALLELLQVSKRPDKFRKVIRKIQIVIILLSLVFYVIVGYGVAEKRQESKQIASHTSEILDYLAPDEVNALNLFCWIDIKVLSSEHSR